MMTAVHALRGKEQIVKRARKNFFDFNDTPGLAGRRGPA